MITECLSCHAPVVFVDSAKQGHHGRRLILDAKPEKRVIVELDGYALGAAGELVRGEKGTLPTEAKARVVDVFTDHHVTCPRAKDWQGKTRRAPPVRSILPGTIF